MNKQITRVAVVALGLLAALVVATTYWQTWAPPGLAARQDNAILRVAQFKIRRGLIYAADGRLLAARRAQKVDGQTFYFRRYPSGPLAAQVVGYSTQSRSRAGLESSLNDYLTGSNSNLGTVLKTTLDQIRGATIKGNNVWLTVKPGAQRVAMQQLEGKCGSVVAIDPRTGKVLVMASRPTYDPNLVESNFARINNIRAACRPAAPLLNRATDGLYTPGSTFKVVTSAAALDSGRYTIDSRFVDKGYCIEYGKQVQNFGDQGGPEVFGSVDFLQALQHSINAVFCEIGKALGAGKVLGTSKQFGFYEDPPLETPGNERSPSGLYKNGKLYFPGDPATEVDPGRLAFGQERMLATPEQMAMVAAAVGNKGVIMEPHAVDRIVSPSGGIVTRPKPRKYKRAMTTRTADDLTRMMEAVVTGGTGTAAQIPGVRVAGKTGTAEVGAGGRGSANTTWFIAFAPVGAPRVAIAVVLQDQTGSGGTTAAPIAKAVMEAILSGKSN